MVMKTGSLREFGPFEGWGTPPGRVLNEGWWILGQPTNGANIQMLVKLAALCLLGALLRQVPATLVLCLQER